MDASPAAFLGTVSAVVISIAVIIAWRPKPSDGGSVSWNTAPTRLTFDDGLQTDPSFSPDGQVDRLRIRPFGQLRYLDAARLAGGNPVQVIHESLPTAQPAWSSDGNRIVFRSERAGGGLFIVPTTGGAAQISSIGFRRRWSPDGRSVDLLRRNHPDGSRVQAAGHRRRWQQATSLAGNVVRGVWLAAEIIDGVDVLQFVGPYEPNLA